MVQTTTKRTHFTWWRLLGGYSWERTFSIQMRQPYSR
jgi:hypothetical protein